MLTMAESFSIPDWKEHVLVEKHFFVEDPLLRFLASQREAR
jgi:hypothetical protein